MTIHFKNTETQYGLVARVLHWGSVALLVTLILISGQFEEMEVSPERLELIITHSSIGLIFMLLMLSRLTWRNMNINPIKSYSMKVWQKIAAISLHRCIYIVLITQCVIGILMLLTVGEPIHFFEFFEIAPVMDKKESFHVFLKNSHAFISIVIYPMFAIHISAAIYHQIFGLVDDD